jgi:hypothetical protein
MFWTRKSKAPQHPLEYYQALASAAQKVTAALALSPPELHAEPQIRELLPLSQRPVESDFVKAYSFDTPMPLVPIALPAASPSPDLYHWSARCPVTLTPEEAATTADLWPVIDSALRKVYGGNVALEVMRHKEEAPVRIPPGAAEVPYETTFPISSTYEPATFQKMLAADRDEMARCIRKSCELMADAKTEGTAARTFSFGRS